MKKRYLVLIIVASLLIMAALTFWVMTIRNAILLKEIEKAIESNDLAAAEKILDKGVNLNRPLTSAIDRFLSESYSSSPLKTACWDGSIEMVRLLVENGADVNYTIENVTPNSPLMCAMRNKTEDQLDIIKYLLESGADPNYSDGRMMSVFNSLISHNRAVKNKLEILKLLEEYGGDLQAVNVAGQSVLDIACYWHENEIIKYLLDKYDNVNCTNDAGYTPLMRYCNGGNDFDITVIEAFIAHGADISAKNKDGKTALDYAVENGYTEAYALLGG